MLKKYIKTTFLSALLLVGTSCELDLLDNPNEVSIDQTNADYVVNNIQLNFASFFEDMSEFGMYNTRMLAMFGNTYENAYQATSFDVVWTTAYAGIFADAKLVLEAAAADTTLDYHAGMAHFFKAYTAMTLVDYFGNIPYSATLDVANFNPGIDQGADVYASAIESIDLAIENFENVNDFTDMPGNDLYYDGDVDLWLAACNTLKLRAYLQTRLVNSSESTTMINNLINENLIDTDGEEFIFRYSSASIADPDSRHPWFSGNYITGGNEYMSNSYINELYQGKDGVQDPRLRYYFYRQTLTTPTDVNVLDCVAQEPPAHYGDDDVFCSVSDDGYWGRDHLDDDGIPPDNLVRTLYGVYPAGGAFDADNGVRGTQDSGLKGGGILPMMMPSFTKFMLSEAALELGTTGDPRTLFEEGVRSSLEYVVEFGSAADTENEDGDDLAATSDDIDNYVTAVLDVYDGAADKLDVVITEYWIALFGNGVDAYNTYRRTGKPEDLQPALSPEAGTYYRSFTYPAVYVTRNNTAEQKGSPAVQVFWDTNPAGSVD